MKEHRIQEVNETLSLAWIQNSYCDHIHSTKLLSFLTDPFTTTLQPLEIILSILERPQVFPILWDTGKYHCKNSVYQLDVIH